ncbi:MAG: MFS transporter [Bacteroidales bacterium]|nr:MFS transporter [Bacteroidales bacterium]
MLRKIISIYINSFKGLSKEVWYLALVTFINRAGTMVIPFLSLYLTEKLHFSLSQVGWIMSSFGIGSFIGSWLGGKLTDKIGFYKVMVWSLLLTGFIFISLQYITSFLGFIVAIFFTMLIADSFRPAMYVSLKAYSRPENQTRSLTLIRLAINLGFSLGPFLGGIIIAAISYNGLFWVDGLTCISAIIVFMTILKEKKNPTQNKIKKIPISDSNKSVYKDLPYWIFLSIVFIMGFTFFQLFSTIPLYYREIHKLSEIYIGLLMSLNGILIFILEMPLIFYLEKTVINKIKVIFLSLILVSLSFFILNISNWFGFLIISMILISFAEMLGFPFTNSFAMDRAQKGQEGKYMALYTMAFSLALIFSSKIGMEVIENYSFNTNWYLMSFLALIAVFLCFWLIRTLKTQSKLDINLSSK